MVWIVKLEEVIDGRVLNQVSVMELKRQSHLSSLDDLGLKLAEAKKLLANTQEIIVAKQIERDAEMRAYCPGCSRRRHIKDYRQRRFDTLFGRQTVRRPRYACCGCGEMSKSNTNYDRLRGRSTPEFDNVRAKLAAQLPYRAAGRILAELLPVSTGVTHETIRNHTLKIGRSISEVRAVRGNRSAEEKDQNFVLGLDTAYIRSIRSQRSRQSHVLVGTIKRGNGAHYRFAALDGVEGALGAATRRHLVHMGYAQSSKVTVLSDGAKVLSKAAREATNLSVVPVLDWFHIAMRVQRMKQIASGLSARVPTHANSKARIQEELAHLHWRLWHGQANRVREIFGRLRLSLGVYRRHVRERRQRMVHRKLFSAINALQRYVLGKEARIIDYHRHHQSGQPVSTSVTESAVNQLVNHRMNKRQQMRWSATGAHFLLQVRSAVLNGEFDDLRQSINLSISAANGRDSIRIAA